MFRFNLWARPFLPPTAQGMEGNPFFPSPLGVPPGLALAGTGSDVNKNGIHVHDKEKEGAVSYTSAFPLFRPGEALPHALYSPIHQQFLRAQLELANAHNNRENDATAVHPAHHFTHASAFAPTKRQRIDDRRETTPSTSPRSASSPSQHQTRCDQLSSPVSQASRTSSPREIIEGRTSVSLSEDRVSPHEDGLRCPICRCTLPVGQDMTTHLAKEIHELQRLGRMSENLTSEEKQHPCKSRYETFLRIRGNREGRLGESKLRGLRRKRPIEDDQFLSNGLDDSMRREEDEQIDVLSCDDPETRITHSISHITESSHSPDTRDKPHDLSRKSASPDVIEVSPSRDSLCCTGCTVSFTKVTPVTSTKCWHVRCDTCWGSNNLEKCPQCNISMTADDLRRIYL